MFMHSSKSQKFVNGYLFFDQIESNSSSFLAASIYPLYIAMASMAGLFLFRLVSCLLAVSLSFLILSSLLLHTSLVPTSVYNLILATNITIEPKSSCNESRLRSNPIEPASFCDRNRALLKVFMYDLPPEFHFGLIGWKGDRTRIWPNVSDLSKIPLYPRGISIQHSMEYWLTLDLLSSIAPNVTTSCSTTVLVQNATQSDVIFVPFFSSWSYNRQCKIRGDRTKSEDGILQERLVEYLKGRDEWRRYGGKDHLIMAHHPNSLLFARKYLGSAIFILADFGRYPSRIANIGKDIVAPYKHVVKRINASDSPSFEERPVLVYFRGGIRRKDGGMIRQTLYDLMKDEKDVNFTFGRPSSVGVREASDGMASAKFCLNLAGDTPSSNRLFDAIASHCVPVIISDEIELPFEDVLDYSKFAIFVRGSDAAKKGYLMRLLRGVRREKWNEMWGRLKQIAPHFEYQYPSQPGDAVDMIWRAVYRKVYSVCDKFRRKNRYEMSLKFLNARKMARVFPIPKMPTFVTS